MRMPAPCPTLLRRRPRRGFTLIEAMIVVAVVAILAAVALPSFMDSIRKGRRSDAFAAISQVQQAQERWRANHASYADQLSTAPPDGSNLSLRLISATVLPAFTVMFAAVSRGASSG